MNKEQLSQFQEAMHSVTTDAVLVRQIRQLLAQTRLRVKKVHGVQSERVRANVAEQAITHIIAEETRAYNQQIAEQQAELAKGGKYGA